jgi:hypothetical protein
MSKWISKKLIVALVGTVLVPLLQKWGVPQDTINWIIAMLGTYIGGQSIVDASKSFSMTDTSGK